MVPNTGDLVLEGPGSSWDGGGFIPVDRVSRIWPAARAVYAGRDCNRRDDARPRCGQQVRIAMCTRWARRSKPLPAQAATRHDRLHRAENRHWSGCRSSAVTSGEADALWSSWPRAHQLAANMQGFRDGFSFRQAVRPQEQRDGARRRRIAAGQRSDLGVLSLAVEQHLSRGPYGAHTSPCTPSCPAAHHRGRAPASSLPPPTDDIEGRAARGVTLEPSPERRSYSWLPPRRADECCCGALKMCT